MWFYALFCCESVSSLRMRWSCTNCSFMLKETSSRFWASKQNFSLWRFFWTRPTGRRLRTDPEHTGGIRYPIWTGRASGSPGGTGRLGYFTKPAANTTQINAVWQNASSIHTHSSPDGGAALLFCGLAVCLHIVRSVSSPPLWTKVHHSSTFVEVFLFGADVHDCVYCCIKFCQFSSSMQISLCRSTSMINLCSCGDLTDWTIISTLTSSHYRPDRPTWYSYHLGAVLDK